MRKQLNVSFGSRPD